MDPSISDPQPTHVERAAIQDGTYCGTKDIKYVQQEVPHNTNKTVGMLQMDWLLKH